MVYILRIVLSQPQQCKMQKNCQKISNQQQHQQKQEQQQPLMGFENGVIVKIFKSYFDPILDGGHLRHPQTKMGISS